MPEDSIKINYRTRKETKAALDSIVFYKPPDPSYKTWIIPILQKFTLFYKWSMGHVSSFNYELIFNISFYGKCEIGEKKTVIAFSKEKNIT